MVKKCLKALKKDLKNQTEDKISILDIKLKKEL